MCGHVFLVHGHLDKLACDAWLVPSGSFPLPGTGWRHAVAAEPPPDSPARWADVTGRVIPWQPLQPEFPRPWVVRTANPSDAAPDDFVEPARQFLSTAAKALPPNPKNGRKLPLLALPVTGAGFAGGARQAGAIVKRLLPEIYQFVERNPIDVALVMKESAQYAAAQAIRTELLGDKAWPNLDDRLRTEVDRLADLAIRQELVLFLGAGVSQAAGLPSWSRLLESLASKELAADRDFKTLAVLDQARVLEKHLDPPRPLGEAVAEQVRGKHYSLVHGLLAALPVQEVITTNYDDLFEAASDAVKREVCVLPYKQASGGRRWLLKMHGCVNHPEDIVLTRKDYLRYDSERAALAGLVQGLLLTRHVLFVGFSLSDDNFHRIADAVRRVTKERFGTALAVAANRLLTEVWGADLNWVEFGELPDSARSLEIFLDRLAARTVSSANHLFDAKYEATLTPSEINLRGQLEALASLFTATTVPERQGAAWLEVERFLGRVGCPLRVKPKPPGTDDERQHS